MTWKELVEGLTNDEVISEMKVVEEAIYEFDCFGTRDVIYLEWLYREIERRGLEDPVTWRERDEQAS